MSGKVANPPTRPIMIYDGDCHFCRYWIERWKWFTGERVDYAASQDSEIRTRFPEISAEQFDTSVQLVMPDGQVFSGAEAVFAVLGSRWGIFKRLYQNVSPLRTCSEKTYRFVAEYRTILSKLNRLLAGPHIELPRYGFTFWVFFRGLGLIYLLAFTSLWSQIIPLVGENGIEPAGQYLDAVNQRVTAGNYSALEKYLRVPTLCWWNSSDGFLNALCAAGVVISMFVVAGLLTGPSVVLLWILYLSLAVVCNTWLGFQWDSLLLEVGLIAVFLAPWRVWENPRSPTSPPLIPILILRWLLFRLMFMSGAVKVLSRDPAWADWTALNHHYLTQPLPTTLAWHAHHLPEWFQKASVGGMFFIELIVPFLIFLPRRLRIISIWPMAGLMLLILMTGNYTFFNWITLLLCFAMLDDQALVQIIPMRWRKRFAMHTRSPVDQVTGLRQRFRQGHFVCTIVFLLVVNSVTTEQLLRTFRSNPPEWMGKLSERLAGLRSINSYGLFAVMTKRRPEIIIEGSNDEVAWKPYEFYYKPGDLSLAPHWVAPHQPRLDWQMWFAALGRVQQNPWFINLCVRLLEGEKTVLTLFKDNPFADRPPRFIQASLYEYHFTNPEEREATGNWWKRELLGLYLQPISFRQSSGG